jgi:DDE superfamily endonuclease
VLVLRWFRDRTDPARLGRDHEVSRATAYRYLDEGIAMLAARAPNLHEALERATGEGLPYVILDGKTVDTDRCAEKTLSVKGRLIDLWYSGKAHRHGGNIQAIHAPDGFPLWISDVAPGSHHDLTVAREQVLAALYATAHHLPTLADGGYDGAGADVLTPVRKPDDGRDLHVDNQTFNMLLRALRCVGERGFALLTQRWRTLQRITASPSRIGDIAKAALTLVHFEHGRPA